MFANFCRTASAASGGSDVLCALLFATGGNVTVYKSGNGQFNPVPGSCPVLNSMILILGLHLLNSLPFNLMQHIKVRACPHIVDWGGFGHGVNSDSIRNVGAI